MKTMFAALLVVLTLTVSSQAGEGEITKKTIRAKDGLNLVCQYMGKGDTALIFLHGWCGERAYWKHQAGAFANDYRVVTFDQAGHGESGKDRKEWTLNNLADDVEAVVKDLGLKRVILVGHSMGGSVALVAAARMPGTVVGVIGVDTLANAEAKLPDEVRRKLIDSFTADFAGTVRNSLSGLLQEKTDAELKNWLITRAAAQDSKMATALITDLFARDLKALFKAAKVPVRCINSSGGFAFHTPTAIAVNKMFSDYDAVLIDGVGHYPMLEKPAEFNEKLREVLKQFKK